MGKLAGRWSSRTVCEWILELGELKIFLRILSEWFPKHLEIVWVVSTPVPATP